MEPPAQTDELNPGADGPHMLPDILLIGIDEMVKPLSGRFNEVYILRYQPTRRM